MRRPAEKKDKKPKKNKKDKNDKKSVRLQDRRLKDFGA
jgi:hypothetical protein